MTAISFFPLVKLAQTIGIDMKLVTADEAYHDGNGAFYEETGIHLTTPPSSKVTLPEHLNPDTLSVFNAKSVLLGGKVKLCTQKSFGAIQKNSIHSIGCSIVNGNFFQCPIKE